MVDFSHPSHPLVKGVVVRKKAFLVQSDEGTKKKKNPTTTGLIPPSFPFPSSPSFFLLLLYFSFLLLPFSFFSFLFPSSLSFFPSFSFLFPSSPPFFLIFCLLPCPPSLTTSNNGSGEGEEEREAKGAEETGKRSCSNAHPKKHQRLYLEPK